MTRWRPLLPALLGLILMTTGCSHQLTIHQPTNGASFGSGVLIPLEAEIRGGEQGCGGEDCNCADWWWTADGAATGLDRSNGTNVSYCRYTWTLPAADLGTGTHTLTIHSDQGSLYRESTKSVTITVTP